MARTVDGLPIYRMELRRVDKGLQLIYYVVERGRLVTDVHIVDEMEFRSTGRLPAARSRSRP